VTVLTGLVCPSMNSDLARGSRALMTMVLRTTTPCPLTFTNFLFHEISYIQIIWWWRWW